MSKTAAKLARISNRELMMKAKNIEERLTLLAVLFVLIGVSSAAEEALAAETAEIKATAVAIHDAAKDAVEIAELANAEAAATLAEENGLGLDIRLDDHRSVLVAGRR